MKTTFIKIKTTKELFLTNTELSIHNEIAWDYQHVEHILPGEEIDVRIIKHDDGRKYYTAFRKVEGIYYCFTTMTRDGKTYPNCGGMRASWELAQYFEDNENDLDPAGGHGLHSHI